MDLNNYQTFHKVLFGNICTYKNYIARDPLRTLQLNDFQKVYLFFIIKHTNWKEFYF